MLKVLAIAIAAVSLSACASLPLGASAPPLDSFDAAPIEAPVQWLPRSGAASVLNRRSFDASIWRQPDRRPLYATASDRRFRPHMRRSLSRRRRAMRSVLLTS